MSIFILGVDLGQAHDYTALAGLECKGTEYKFIETIQDPEMDLPADVEKIIEGAPVHFQIRYLERMPLSTTYPAVVKHIAELMAKIPGGALLAVDQTGVGRPVYDLLEEKGLSAFGITITGGSSVQGEGLIWRVPKRDLIAVAQVAIQDKRMLIARDLELAPVLVDELLNFKVKIDPETAHDSYNAREGAYDDIVLAVSIAAWVAQQIYAGPTEETITYEEHVHISDV